MLEPSVRASFDERGLLRLDRIELPAPRVEEVVPVGRSFTCWAPIAPTQHRVPAAQRFFRQSRRWRYTTHSHTHAHDSHGGQRGTGGGGVRQETALVNDVLSSACPLVMIVRCRRLIAKGASVGVCVYVFVYAVSHTTTTYRGLGQPKAIR
uniref:Uncharacterized protein n=1 Tax=Anopheles farauti TaxID=69004 RepID=A0A182QUN2_9DIPT